MLQTATHKNISPKTFWSFFFLLPGTSLRWYLSCHVVVVWRAQGNDETLEFKLLQTGPGEASSFARCFVARQNRKITKSDLPWRSRARPLIWHFMLAMLWNKEYAFFVWGFFGFASGTVGKRFCLWVLIGFFGGGEKMINCELLLNY